MACSTPSFSVCFSIINEAEVDVFLVFSCFPYNPTNVGNLISDSSAFSKPSLYIWKFSIHVLLKPSLKDFEHNLTSMQDEHNCMVVWILFGTALLWNLNENWPFPVGANEGRLLLARMSTWSIQGRADSRQDWQSWYTGLGWLEGNFDIPNEHNSSTAWWSAWATAITCFLLCHRSPWRFCLVHSCIGLSLERTTKGSDVTPQSQVPRKTFELGACRQREQSAFSGEKLKHFLCG